MTGPRVLGRCVLRLCGPADGSVSLDGVRQFVADYDPDRVHRDWRTLPGGGSVRVTLIRRSAAQFDTPTEALDLWRRQSTRIPMRPDGKPNRPLTAYHVAVEPLDPEVPT